MPVAGFIDKPPELALYEPPPVPTRFTVTGAEELQKGDPLYDITAVGNAVTVIGLVDITCGHPPDAVIVFVTV